MVKVRLSKSSLSIREIFSVIKVLKKGFLGMGNETMLFEQELSSFFGRQAVCVNTGTSALHLACQALGLKEGDEVLVQSITYVASFQAISATGATPIPCDINLSTLQIDLEKAKGKISVNTKAIMPVFIGGYPGELDEIYRFAEKNKLRVIEDAAHAFGSKHNDKYIGSFGDITCFSLDGIKNITSGEGGVVVSADADLMERVKDLRLLGVEKDSENRYKGLRSWDFDVKEQGWRYHMSDINAAIGRVQLKRRDELALKRQRIALLYRKVIRERYQMSEMWNYNDIVPHVFIVMFDTNAKREKCKLKLLDLGVQTGLHYKPNHLLTFFAQPNTKGDFINSEYYYSHALTLPMHPDLRQSEIKKIARIVNNI